MCRAVNSSAKPCFATPRSFAWSSALLFWISTARDSPTFKTYNERTHHADIPRMPQNPILTIYHQEIQADPPRRNGIECVGTSGRTHRAPGTQHFRNRCRRQCRSLDDLASSEQVEQCDQQDREFIHPASTDECLYDDRKEATMKLLPQEIKRIRQNALLEQQVSPDLQPTILTKTLNVFAKDVQTTLRRNKRIKNAIIVVLEGEES